MIFYAFCVAAASVFAYQAITWLDHKKWPDINIFGMIPLWLVLPLFGWILEVVVSRIQNRYIERIMRDFEKLND